MDTNNTITYKYNTDRIRISKIVNNVVAKYICDSWRNIIFFTYDEGLCVQCMHIGSYDEEPATVDLMHKYIEENEYELDITDDRYHHEIYLSDPRKCEVSKLKTVVRHRIKKIN